jgi:hypothetical protein
MTRTGATKQVDASHAFGRLTKAKAFHQVAKLALAHAGQLRDSAPVAANAILAAIAYADAVAAAYGGRINQKDHAAGPKLLRAVLGKALPDSQENRLARLLGRKDEMQYGARLGRSQDAEQIVAQLDDFAAWAETMLAALAISTATGESG